jgi:hypothetical protein
MFSPTIARRMRPNTHSLDDDSASRLLQGLVHPDDAPPGYGSVARLLNAAGPLAPVDEDAAANTVSAMVEVIRASDPVPETSRRKSMIGKLLAGKAVAAIAVVGLTASGAAAASGSLPDPVQNAVAGAVSHVGVDIPHPNHGKSAGHRQDADHRQDGQGDESGDDQGQAPDNHGSDVSQFVEDNKGTVEGPFGQEVCKVASDNRCRPDSHGKSGDDHGTPSSTGASTANRGRNSDDPAGESGGDHGKGEVTPPTTPTTGSIETGDDHSGGRAESGSDNSGRDSSGSDE